MKPIAASTTHCRSSVQTQSDSFRIINAMAAAGRRALGQQTGTLEQSWDAHCTRRGAARKGVGAAHPGQTFCTFWFVESTCDSTRPTFFLQNAAVCQRNSAHEHDQVGSVEDAEVLAHECSEQLCHLKQLQSSINVEGEDGSSKAHGAGWGTKR